MENIDVKDKSVLESVLGDRIKDIVLVSETNNRVYRVNTDEGVLYAKFYKENSSHLDNELRVYELADNRYLKEIYYKSETPKMAIFRELVGKTVDELSDEEITLYGDRISDSIIDFFQGISTNKTTGYGILDDNLCGKYSDFLEFLRERQGGTSEVLRDYPELSDICNYLLDTYGDLMNSFSDNGLVPIDTNLKNIMVMEDGSVKFIDPGEMISGPVLMGYGDIVAHVYKTPLYDSLICKLGLSEDEEKLVRIYAVFSTLNILAFLKKLGVEALDEVIPYGNTYTFSEMTKEHVLCLKK